MAQELVIDGNDWIKAPWYIRLAATLFIKWFLKNHATSYQCSGEVNWLFPNRLDTHMREHHPKHVEICSADIQVPYYQLAHWMINSAYGPRFSCYSLLKEWGTPEQVEELDGKPRAITESNKSVR